LRLKARTQRSTIAFTVCFAVWTIFSIIGIQIKAGAGSDRDAVRPAGRHADPDRLADPLMLGIWTDQYGGRIVYVG
jgi:NNP family nitrate/nitrite transporter-like MFS transporter